MASHMISDVTRAIDVESDAAENDRKVVSKGGFAAYLQAGEARARALGNRGPLRFGADGRLAPEIVEAYRETGFFVFEGVLDAQELSELDADLACVLDQTPAYDGADVDRQGRPRGAEQPHCLWAEPLSDPWGGTTLLNGRHPVAMEEPAAAEGTPEKAIFLLLGLFEAMPAALRLSAHPKMLGVAESLAGREFVPYNDTIFLKEPGLGASIAWHQDGTTHWDRPDWDPDIHGFNFMAQLCRTTPGNGLWVVPGSHREGRIDIPARVAANGGSTRLPDAVPMLCDRGDVAVCNRQCLHASFANASPDRRVTFVWGFFRRDAVLGAEVDMPATHPGEAPARRRYTAEDIAARQALVQLAIETRHVHRRDEQPHPYAPTASPSPRPVPATLRGYRDGTIFL